MKTDIPNHSLLTAVPFNAATFETAQLTVLTIWKQVAKWFSPRIPSLHIHQHFNRSGQVYWSGFDPYTGSFIRWVSEPEIRVWIERRYR